MSTQQFIDKAVQVHGNRYGYSRVEYKTAINKVSIICAKHGEFRQLPHNHCRGSGCPKCRIQGTVPLTSAQFVDKAKKIHGDRYSYGMVHYKNNDTKIAIVCKIHGIFMQVASDHMKGRGCPLCNGTKQNPLGLEVFLERAHKKHGDKYDYSKVSYRNVSSRVPIGCPEHGFFLQSPYRHVVGKGCPKCREITTEDFVRRAIEKHGAKYNYSKAVYTHSQRNVEIICSIHGVFSQRASHHIEGGGCPKCGLKNANNNKRYTTESFIKKAIAAHESRYSYENVQYIDGRTSVSITCPIHGSFRQRPSAHYGGQGCPSCQRSVGEERVAKWLDGHQISWVSQKRFSGCRGSRYPLPFDFFLPQHNTCIEFDGAQHYTDNIWFYKSLSLEEKQKRQKQSRENDRIKTDYCGEHGIKLIRIREKNSINSTLRRHFSS